MKLSNEEKLRLRKLEDWVKKECASEKSGHDYEHAKRVTEIASDLARDYKKVNLEVLTASCLIHDLYRNYLGKEYNFKKILRKFGFSKEKVEKIIEVIRQFRHIGKEPKRPFRKTIESELFLDADTLDALGAVGIIRAILFGKFKEFPIFISKKDKLNDSIYGTIKEILKWPDSIFSKKAKRMGKRRIKIMKLFLINIEKEFGKL